MGKQRARKGTVTAGTESRARAWASDSVLLLATVVWGSTFVVVHEALREWPPFLFLALRFTIGAGVLAPFVLARRGRPSSAAVRAGAVVGVWLFLGFALQTLGLAATTPTRAAFITGWSVVLVPSFSIAVYRRLPTPASIVGVGLATCGLVLLTGGAGEAVRRGDLLVLGCAVAFAFQILAVGHRTAAVGPAMLLLGELAMVALLSWPAALLLEKPRLPSSIAAWAALLYVTFAATLGALGAQNWAQKRTPPTRAAVIFTMEPVFASAFSWLATGEGLSARGWAGSVLILAGMLAAELLPRPPAPAFAPPPETRR